VKIPDSLTYVAVPVLEWRGLSLCLFMYSWRYERCEHTFVVERCSSTHPLVTAIDGHEWLASLSYRRKITPCARRTGCWMETIADVDFFGEDKNLFILSGVEGRCLGCPARF